jgi:hypothetical protein
MLLYSDHGGVEMLRPHMEMWGVDEPEQLVREPFYTHCVPTSPVRTEGALAPDEVCMNTQKFVLAEPTARARAVMRWQACRFALHTVTGAHAVPWHASAGFPKCARQWSTRGWWS